MKKKKSSTRLWKNSDLVDFFDRYNTLYFGRKLERPCDLRFIKMDFLGETVRVRAYKRRSKEDKFAIRIATSIRSSRRLWGCTMLHEMVHYKQKNRYACGAYGRIHNKEMKRLAAAGAFNGLW